MPAPGTKGRARLFYRKFYRPATRPRRGPEGSRRKNSTRRRGAGRSGACTTRAAGAAIDASQILYQALRTESCGMPCPTRRTTGIPTCPASRGCRGRKSAASRNCGLADGVSPVVSESRCRLSTSLRRRSRKTVWSTKARHSLGGRSAVLRAKSPWG